MRDAVPEFEDVNLRATIRRAAGAVGADAGLRAAMTELVEREVAAEKGRRAPRRVVRWLAMAAVLLVAAGTGAVLYQRHHDAAERAEYLAANLPLFEEMIRVEQGAPGAGEEALPVGDREGLREALSTKLGRAVPVPDWREKGWRLASAAVGRVGAFPAAELRYENGGRRLLFVSLPAKAYSGHEGEEPEPYEYTVGGHALAGFVRAGGLHCVIGGAGVPAGEVGGLKVE